jgi:CBS domain-containing membrane protein
MNATERSFSNLTAEDLMSREVISIPQDLSLRAAARLLARSQISGAPVVDEAGVCVGVLSATDFIRWTERTETPICRDEADFGCVCADWQVLEGKGLPADNVRRYMTADPVTAPPGTPVGALARLMLDAHIHRVIVVDARKRPIGVISSTDILAAVARATVEE